MNMQPYSTVLSVKRTLSNLFAQVEEEEDTVENTMLDVTSSTGELFAEGDNEWSDLPNVFVLNDNVNIDNIFTIKEELGKGSSCAVYKVIKKENGSEYAMKQLSKSGEWGPKLFRQEISILDIIKHPNILEYCEAYVTKDYFYICTRLCRGTRLLDQVKKCGCLSEKAAANILYELIKIVSYLHENQICHRDIKLENIVYDSDDYNSKLILIDLADSAMITKKCQIFSDYIGTPAYLSPECMRNRSGTEMFKADMWAIGVLGYMILTGRPPFYAADRKYLLKKICNAKIKWPRDLNLSNSCKQFISSLIQKDPKIRLSAKQALEHPWILNQAAQNDEFVGFESMLAMSKFHSACKLKKLVAKKIAHETMTDSKEDIISSATIESLKAAFYAIDDDSDGLLNNSDLCKHFENIGLNTNAAKIQAMDLMNALKTHDDKLIDFTEFLIGRNAVKLCTNSRLITEQFNQIASPINENISKYMVDSDTDCKTSTSSSMSSTTVSTPSTLTPTFTSGGNCSNGFKFNIQCVSTTTNDTEPRMSLMSSNSVSCSFMSERCNFVITKQDLECFFGDMVSINEIDDIINELDKSGSGFITFNMFENAMKQINDDVDVNINKTKKIRSRTPSVAFSETEFYEMIDDLLCTVCDDIDDK